jgi:hypothetical protein
VRTDRASPIGTFCFLEEFSVLPLRHILRTPLDSLMLLDHSAWIVLEVDGKHHYADGDHSPARTTPRWLERIVPLRPRGYGVHRFGGAEFSDAWESDGGQEMAQKVEPESSSSSKNRFEDTASSSDSDGGDHRCR